MIEEITPPKRNAFWQSLFLMVAIVAATSMVTVWLTSNYLFPTSFKPVELSNKERKALDVKLKDLNIDLRTRSAAIAKNKGAETTAPVLAPERYSEEGASREASFSEREINALIANNTDLASKVAVDLSKDLVSLKVLMPMDPDMPFVGGKTLKASAGLELAYKNGKPIVILKGVSLWGVPMPNSWLGNLKEVDLVREFGNGGFWKSFAAGVDYIEVNDENLVLKLKK